MPIDPTHYYYQLTKHEAELLDGYRLMSEAAQETVTMIIASQARPVRQELAQPVERSAVPAL